MTGQTSTLELPPPPRACEYFDLSCLMWPFVPGGRPPAQAVVAKVRDRELIAWTLDDICDLRFRIPGELAPPDAPLVIRFDHPDPVESTDAAGERQHLAAAMSRVTAFGHGDAIPAEPVAPAGTPPILHVRSKGNVGNRMIQFMAALTIQVRVPDTRLSGIALDEWGISTGDHGPEWCDHAITDPQHVDAFAVARFLRTHPGSKVALRGYAQRMSNFLEVEAYRRAFPARVKGVPVFDRRYLVINVRSGDVVAGNFADYVLIPVAFYRQIVRETGLIPVFMGQVAPNAYTDLLRAAFPTALFLESQGAMWDFEVIRTARNIVTAVSTFSWLAAWLSRAERIIMPVDGLLNPIQFPDIDLLPLDDPRFVFYLFPVNHACPPDRIAEVHATLEGRWCRVSPAMLTEIRMRAEAA
jgi:hypothetical protein